MNIESIQQNSKTIFISLIAFSVVVLVVVSYFVFVGNDKNTTNIDNKPKTETIIKPKNNNITPPSVSKNEKNNVNSLMKNIESNPNTSTALLENIRDNTYKDFTGKQVFNISNNIFTYDDAKAACMAYNAELATYDQVMDAYKNGAEWCNYGWSENQQALYPTQESTWKELQKKPEHAQDCGHFGINGGYFENPNTLFGANCYGVKPEPKDRERIAPMPASEHQRNLLAKMEKYKQEKEDLTIKPFNERKWSRNK